MREALLLYLTADRLMAQKISRAEVVAQHTFNATPEDYKRFAEFIAATHCTTYFLTDLVEEDFRQEFIPHLHGRNRAALLARKFEHFYRHTSFHCATHLGRKKSGRRDDDTLFSALTNPHLITPWLKILQIHKIPLAGIYSVPHLSAPLIKNHHAEHLLLISWAQYTGLRQTFFKRHQLHISRLTPPHDELDYPQAVIAELGRTHQYLKNLNLLPAGEILDVYFLGCPADLQELKNQLPANGEMRYDFGDLNLLTKVTPTNNSDATPLFLQQLMLHPPRSSYANAEHTRYHLLRRVKTQLNLAALLLILLVMLWAGFQLSELNNSQHATELLRTETQTLSNEIRQAVATISPSTTAARDMKSAVLLMQNLEQNSPPPASILQPLSRVLDSYRQIELYELSWQADQKLTLKASLIDFARQPRAALDYFDQFQRELAAQTFQVSVLEPPLNLSSTASIAEQNELADASYFSLQLTRKSP